MCLTPRMAAGRSSAPSDVGPIGRRRRPCASAGLRAALVLRGAFPNCMSNDLPAHLRPARSFQGLILALQRYWADHGCVILQPYDMEVGAGTFHPPTTLRALGPNPSTAPSVQPSRRPTAARYGAKPKPLRRS